jgi:hypothetical protein
MRKLVIVISIISILGFSSCKKCWDCVDKSNKTVKYSLCNDEPAYSSSYYESWKYLCASQNGEVVAK